jgi:DNA helicase-2/ATP-dependent DNA helicase PcrA
MNLSQYQEAIIEWAKTKKGHGCCNAVAGSGKSTTLRLVAKALEESGFSPSDIKVCVFGKANSLDLIKKFGKAWEQSISTLHSAGWSLIKKHLNIQNPKGLIKNNKYQIIAQDLGLIAKRGKTSSKLRDKGAITKDNDFVTLLDLVRLTNSVEELETDTVKTICKHFELSDIWNFSYVTDAIIDVIDEGEFLAHKGQFFDFCDQIWLPVRWELGKEKWFEPYQFVLVDECQDLNAAQLELALSLAGTDGRILAVGDPRQAIMGFAGADNRSYQKIVERLQATELPLSICYRCPKSHINLVKQNFPEIPIEANQNAIEGKIEQNSPFSFFMYQINCPWDCCNS